MINITELCGKFIEFISKGNFVRNAVIRFVNFPKVDKSCNQVIIRNRNEVFEGRFR